MDEYAKSVIDALGGTTAVARMADAPTSTVHSWRTIGIPSSRMAHLRLLAEKNGVALPELEASASGRTDDVGAGEPPFAPTFTGEAA